MKNIILLIFLSLLYHQTALGQCNADLYSEKSMKEITQGYMYEKSYRIDGRDGRKPSVEYSCIMSKDVNYAITMSGKDGGSKGIVFSLFDSKRNLVATNYVNDKFFAGIEYRCKSTDIYILNFTFKESRSHCGAAVLAFRR